MDTMKLCCVLITVVLLIQSTLSASTIRRWQVGRDIGVSRLTQDVLADLSELDVKKRVSNPFLQLNRSRRNTAQWYVGSQHFNDYNHDRESRRWTHRRHKNHNHNHHGRGQIVDA